MSFIDKRPVFKNKTIEKAFKNAEFFFTTYNSDCPICLEFFENPQILPCGHCFCHLCVTMTLEFTKNCPLCSEFFWIFKPVKFYFTETIKEFILLRRLKSNDVNNKNAINFYTFPFALEYFEEDIKINNRYDECTYQNRGITKFDDFYQSHDGQLYFLDPKTTKSLTTKPEYIYSKIISRDDCTIDYREFPNLTHIPSGTRIVIIKIET